MDLYNFEMPEEEEEIVKNLVPDASEDETIKFIEKFC